MRGPSLAQIIESETWQAAQAKVRERIFHFFELAKPEDAAKLQHLRYQLDALDSLRVTLQTMALELPDDKPINGGRT